jgi:glycosyltransferase involved in cell wall biosynthesis
MLRQANVVLESATVIDTRGEISSVEDRLSVLHVSGRSDHGGGPEHIYQIITSDSADVDHLVSCPDSGVYWKRYRQLLPAENMIAIPHRRFSIQACVRLYQFMKKRHVDVIHSHGSCGGLYGRLLGTLFRIPVIHTFHGIPVTLTPKHVIFYLTEIFLSLLTERAIAVSDGEASIIRSRWPFYSKKLSIVYNGIDDHELDGHLRNEVNTKPRLISFSRNNYQKNPEFLIEVASELSRRQVDFRLDVYGEQIDHPRLAEHAERHGVSSKLSFNPPIDNPNQILRQGDIYISTSRWEGMPLSILEAWSAGAVVVATDVVGNRDLINDGVNGRLYQEGDKVAASNIISGLLSDRAEMRRLRSAAKFDLQNGYSREEMISHLESIYHSSQSIPESRLNKRSLEQVYDVQSIE